MKANTKIGIAGCGWIAQNAHIPSFSKAKGAEIVSVFDLNFNRAVELAQKLAIPNAFCSFDRFLESGIEAVVICTPNYTHRNYSIKALKKGVHVLCEKPIALNVDEVKEIAYTARKYNRVFMPGHVNRFRKDILKVKELIELNKIGRIKNIKAGWVRKKGVPRPGSWYTDKSQSGGGVLIDLGSHIIDLCLMFAGKEEVKNASLKAEYKFQGNMDSAAQWFKMPGEEYFQVNVEDTVHAQIELSGGALIEVELCWLSPVKGDYTYFDIYGSEGSIHLKTLFGFSNDKLWEKDCLTVNQRDFPEAVINFDESNSTQKAFDFLAEYFLQTIAGRKMNLLTLEDGYRVVAAIEKLYRSVE